MPCITTHRGCVGPFRAGLGGQQAPQNPLYLCRGAVSSPCGASWLQAASPPTLWATRVWAGAGRVVALRCGSWATRGESRHSLHAGKGNLLKRVKRGILYRTLRQPSARVPGVDGVRSSAQGRMSCHCESRFHYPTRASCLLAKFDNLWYNQSSAMGNCLQARELFSKVEHLW